MMGRSLQRLALGFCISGALVLFNRQRLPEYVWLAVGAIALGIVGLVVGARFRRRP